MNGRLKNWLQEGALYFLLELALIAALAVTLAHWTWIFFAPPAVAAPAIVAQSESAANAHAIQPGLFGSRPASPEAGASFSMTGLKLVGVASPGDPAAGRAIFVLENGKSKTAHGGEAVVPGLILKEVHANHVLIEREGAIERLRLERRAASLDANPRAGRDGGR